MANVANNLANGFRGVKWRIFQKKIQVIPGQMRKLVFSSFRGRKYFRYYHYLNLTFWLLHRLLHWPNWKSTKNDIIIRSASKYIWIDQSDSRIIYLETGTRTNFKIPFRLRAFSNDRFAYCILLTLLDFLFSNLKLIHYCHARGLKLINWWPVR